MIYYFYFNFIYLILFLFFLFVSIYTNIFKNKKGHILQNKIDFFEMYEDYFLNVMKIYTILESKSKTDKKGLGSFFTNCNKNNTTTEVSITSQFTTPIIYISVLKKELESILLFSNDFNEKIFISHFLSVLDPITRYSNLSSFSVLESLDKKLSLDVPLAVDYRLFFIFFILFLFYFYFILFLLFFIYLNFILFLFLIFLFLFYLFFYFYLFF